MNMIVKNLVAAAVLTSGLFLATQPAYAGEGDGKCGEGKCSDSKKPDTHGDKKPSPTPTPEKGKCGEGKCGGGK